MARSNVRRVPGRGRHTQSGQALVYGLGLMAVALGGLFFLFNTGQLLQEKTKLVNTADAAAYAAGVMQARALNFNAYGNRALVANEVLVAQLVSISSWSLYAQQTARNVPAYFPGCISPEGAAAYTTFVFGRYELSCVFVTATGSSIEQLAQSIQSLGSPLLTAVEASKSIIKASLMQLHLPAEGLVKARNTVLQEVVNANYVNDGVVTVQPSGNLPGAFFGLTDQWPDFVRQYSGNERTRMATLARNSAFTESFVPGRNWTERALLPRICGHDKVVRSGGTDLIGLDEWRASDAFVYQHRYFRRWRCRTSTAGLGYGHTSAQNGGGAYSSFSSQTWSQYSGIPAYYDLKVLDQSSPTLRLTVKLSRAADQLKTGDARASVKSVDDGNELNPNRFFTRLKGNKMQAMSASEVFFERPVAAPNARGQELASLFNPFWQVRLIQPSATEVALHAERQ